MRNLNDYADECHRWSYKAGWWSHGKEDPNVLAAKLALVHSEVSEALEGMRKNIPDDHLPHRRMEEVELADVLIRVFDYAAARGFDLEGAFQEKLSYNVKRADHKLDARNAAGGKRI